MLVFEDACPNRAPPRSVIRNATEMLRNAIFFFVIFISPQPFLRIFGAIVLPDLEIEIGRRRLFALCRSCNRLARCDAVARCHGSRLQVAIERKHPVAVIENDQIAISLEPLRKKNCSTEYCTNRSTCGCFDFDSVVGRESVEFGVPLASEPFHHLAVSWPRQRSLDRSDVERPGSSRGFLLREYLDQPLQTPRLLLELLEMLFGPVLLALERCNELFLLRVGGGDRTLPVLDDPPNVGDPMLPVGQVAPAERELFARRLEARYGSRVARDEEVEHRHRLDRIAAVVHREQHPQIAQLPHPVERREAFAEELLLPLDARREVGGLCFDRLSFVVEVLLRLDRQIELARADAELQIDRLQLLLRRFGLTSDVVELPLQPRDLVAEPVEVGRLRPRGGERQR